MAQIEQDGAIRRYLDPHERLGGDHIRSDPGAYQAGQTMECWLATAKTPSAHPTYQNELGFDRVLKHLGDVARMPDLAPKDPHSKDASVQRVRCYHRWLHSRGLRKYGHGKGFGRIYPGLPREAVASFWQGAADARGEPQWWREWVGDQANVPAEPMTERDRAWWRQTPEFVASHKRNEQAKARKAPRRPEQRCSECTGLAARGTGRYNYVGRELETTLPDPTAGVRAASRKKVANGECAEAYRQHGSQQPHKLPPNPGGYYTAHNSSEAHWLTDEAGFPPASKLAQTNRRLYDAIEVFEFEHTALLDRAVKAYHRGPAAREQFLEAQWERRQAAFAKARLVEVEALTYMWSLDWEYSENGGRPQTFLEVVEHNGADEDAPVALELVGRGIERRYYISHHPRYDAGLDSPEVAVNAVRWLYKRGYWRLLAKVGIHQRALVGVPVGTYECDTEDALDALWGHPLQRDPKQSKPTPEATALRTQLRNKASRQVEAAAKRVQLAYRKATNFAAAA